MLFSRRRIFPGGDEGVDVGERDPVDRHRPLLHVHARGPSTFRRSRARYRWVYSSQKPGEL